MSGAWDRAHPLAPAAVRCSEDYPLHAWESTGLDIVDGVLCQTRRCVRCGAESAREYRHANKRRQSAVKWRMVP